MKVLRSVEVIKTKIFSTNSRQAWSLNFTPE